MILGLIVLVIVIVVAIMLLADTLFVVKQQHAVIIERLGKFNRIVGGGLSRQDPGHRPQGGNGVAPHHEERL